MQNKYMKPKVICEKKYIFILFIIVLLSGCVQNKTPGMQNAGYPLQIDEDNYITVKDSYIEDNALIIELEIKLASYTFNDFIDLKVCEQVSDAKAVSCDYEKTIERNDCNIFEDASSLDTVYLVFSDEIFKEDVDLTLYALQFSIKDKETEGVAHTMGMLIKPTS